MAAVREARAPRPGSPDLARVRRGQFAPAGRILRAARRITLTCLIALVPGMARAAAVAVVYGARGADSLLVAGAGRERDYALERWATRASLPELMYLLRQPPARLGAVEVTLTEAALRLAPVSRVALRRRLLLRLAAADPRKAERVWRELVPDAARLPARPRASVFRVAALLPDTGDYQTFGRAVRLGFQAGLSQDAAAATPLSVMSLTSGDDSPERVAAAFDRAADEAGVIVGGLLSVPTATLATAARLTGLPLLSPTATDESIGAIGPGIFQVGPSGLQRGRALARSVLADAPRRIGILTAGPADGSPFSRGFAATAESLGAKVVWTASYTPGSPDFKAELKAIKARTVELLFWDGEARDGETLLRAMAQDKMNLAICGGAELDPERHHPQTRILLEGVVFVGEDWLLGAGAQALLDSAAHAAGDEHANRLHTRGYLAARLLAAAVAGGALCPEELAASLTTRVGADPYLRSHGFLDWNPAEATLPVYAVTRGRPVAR